MRSLWFILLAGLLAFLAGCSSPTEPNSGPIITDAKFIASHLAGEDPGDWSYACETWLDVSRDCDYTLTYWINDVLFWSNQGHIQGPVRIYRQLSASSSDLGSSWKVLWTAGDESRELTGTFQ